MPSSSKINELREVLKELMKTDSSIKQRKSPLGLSEYILPDEIANYLLQSRPGYQTNAATFSDSEGPATIYRQGMANNPVTQAHERIHAGQYMTPNQPTAVQLTNSLGVPRRDIDEYGESGAYEYPAYKFSESQNQQELVNKYLDLIYRMNPNQSQALEASMPQDLLREYIKSHPRPLNTYKPTIK